MFRISVQTGMFNVRLYGRRVLVLWELLSRRCGEREGGIERSITFGRVWGKKMEITVV